MSSSCSQQNTCLTSVKSILSWRIDEQSTKGTRVTNVAMNWNVICKNRKWCIWHVKSNPPKYYNKDVTGAHHALAEVIGVNTWQCPHEQGQHMSRPLRKALPTRHQAAGYADHAAQGCCKLVRFCQSLQSRVGPVMDKEKRVMFGLKWEKVSAVVQILRCSPIEHELTSLAQGGWLAQVSLGRGFVGPEQRQGCLFCWTWPVRLAASCSPQS